MINLTIKDRSIKDSSPYLYETWTPLLPQIIHNIAKKLDVVEDAEGTQLGRINTILMGR